MLRLIMCIVLYCTVSFSQPFPFAPTLPLPIVPPVIPPGVAPIVPIVPTAYPFAPKTRPLSGVAGYRNPLIPSIAGYNGPLVPGVSGYNSPLDSRVTGYNNPYNPYQYTRSAGVAVPILSYSSEHVGDGTYSFSFTTADGKQAQEAGYLKDAYINNAGEPQGTQVVKGSYAYISPDGTPIQVSYIADENGFRPSEVRIPADGTAVVPVIGDKERQLRDPLYNRYDPLNYPNQYNNVGKFNRPYEPKYQYGASNYNNNPYLNNQYLALGLSNKKYEKVA